MNAVTLSLNDEFRLLCILLGLSPEVFLQHFVNVVYIPSEHLQPDSVGYLCTNFIVNYAELKALNLEAYTEEQKAFLIKKERQYQTLRKNSGKYGEEDAAEAMKFFLKIWLREWEER